MLSEGKYSFHKLTPYSQGNTVLGSLASEILHFLTRDSVILHFKRMELFCTNMMLNTTIYNPEL
jgi:hypothetical protein